MTKNENDLEQAYLSGLEASLWWGKFTEFLYATNEGEAIRKELRKDYLAWQIEELGRDPNKGLMEWQALFRKLFSDNIPQQKEVGRKKKKSGTEKTKKGKEEKEVSPSGIKKPKKIVNKPRKIELKAVKTKKTEGGGTVGKKGKAVKNGSSAVKTKKEIKFKNIK